MKKDNYDIDKMYLWTVIAFVIAVMGFIIAIANLILTI